MGFISPLFFYTKKKTMKRKSKIIIEPEWMLYEIVPTYRKKHPGLLGPTIHTSKDAFDYFKPIYDSYGDIAIRERFIAAFLSRRNCVISWTMCSQGGCSGTVVDIKTIVLTALACNSSGVLISHNHPSGNKKPSDSDKSLTIKASSALKFHDINLLDHIIACPNLDGVADNYFSFADEGLM